MQRLIIITVLWVGFILQAVAVETLSSGVLAKGTQWETAFYQRDSGVDGPVVLVTGGIHGNEPAGARAAEQVRHWPIKKGRLIVVPRANIPGLKAGTRHLPGESKMLHDLNRNFPMTGGELVARGVLAVALWEFVESSGPDLEHDIEYRQNLDNLNLVKGRQKESIKRERK